MELNKAKSAYEEADYESAAKIYQEYAKRTNDAQSYFNAGNSFYKQKKYKESVALYEKAIFSNEKYKAKKLANLGNAHAMQGDYENLLKAKKYYEESLKMLDDLEIKDNLENVIEKIEEQESQEQDKKNKEDQGKKGQKKEQPNKQEQDKQDKQEQNKDAKQEQKQEQQDKEEQNKEENQKSQQQDQEGKNKDGSQNQDDSTKKEEQKAQQDKK
jgi:Ca-activated chloride channel family protein